MSRINTCVVCNSKLVYLLSGYDYLHHSTTKKFNVHKCPTCKLQVIVPTPNSEEIISFYPSDYYSFNILDKKSHGKGLFETVKEKIVAKSYGDKVAKDLYYWIALVTKKAFSGLPLRRMGRNNFLDVGCGDGASMDLMSRYGWHCTGFEIGADKTEGNIHYSNSIANIDFRDLNFDFIRVWHVLEHVGDPHSFLNKLESILAVNGEIAVGIPNTASIYSALFGKYWYNRDLPRHLINYNVTNLRALLGQHDLEIVKVKHQSAGGLLGSIQHIINDKRKKQWDLINKPYLMLVFYPFDILTNLLRAGDCISLTIRRKSENSIT
jgi:2-polyprenyl-3-methyl-5-hydroxy-6-metoxy-1,4-benzoquinol methylase